MFPIVTSEIRNQGTDRRTCFGLRILGQVHGYDPAQVDEQQDRRYTDQPASPTERQDGQASGAARRTLHDEMRQQVTGPMPRRRQRKHRHSGGSRHQQHGHPHGEPAQPTSSWARLRSCRTTIAVKEYVLNVPCAGTLHFFRDSEPAIAASARRNSPHVLTLVSRRNANPSCLAAARPPYVTISFSTRAPSTPVSLASSPWNLTLKASCWMPSWCSIVACRSWAVQTSSTAA